LTKSEGKTVSHSRNGYLIRSQVPKKSAPRRKPETAWSRAFSGFHQSFVEHFSCVISRV
jgi:hypothetical protein